MKVYICTVEWNWGAEADHEILKVYSNKEAAQRWKDNAIPLIKEMHKRHEAIEKQVRAPEKYKYLVDSDYQKALDQYYLDLGKADDEFEEWRKPFEDDYIGSHLGYNPDFEEYEVLDE